MSASPVVYFIDDSATMREVIKIAFRRENINVIACHDPASAMTLMDQTAPDVVISDVIMPEKDGYEVCQYIKQHPVLSKTPVILMSGVVNRSVAERAFAVKADELIRKPFQPQDLITRVRHLLHDRNVVRPAPPSTASVATMAALNSIFQTPAGSGRPLSRSALAVVPRLAPAEAVLATVGVGAPGISAALGETPAAVASPAESVVAAERPLAQNVTMLAELDEPLAGLCAEAVTPGGEQSTGEPAPPVSVPVTAEATSASPAPPPAASAVAESSDSTPAEVPPPTPLAVADRKPRVPEPPKTRIEILRLKSQIKKLEAELAAEREYARALEEHIKTLQEAE